ncbi:hypothetical protein OH77DRAFT_1492511 [Trametes cingulata]|nr:hypothetical protein OH77DRAFT_1492511 [Trametes cingulata]
MSSDAVFRKFDDTDPDLDYTGQWTHNTGVSGVFNNTLTSTLHPKDTVHIEFTASQIVIIGATIAPTGASSDSGPVSAYTLDGARNSLFLYQADVANEDGVVFYNSGPLSFGSHTLDITVVTITDNVPYLLDAVFLAEPQQTATSTAVWVSTVFVTPSAAPSSLADTSNVSNNSTSTTASSSSSVPVGAIVGGAVGGAALLVAAILAFYFLFFRRRRHGVYAYHSFGDAPIFDSEKDHPADKGLAPQASQIEPFLAPTAATAYSDTPAYTPHASSGVPSTPGTPHVYPPAPSSASGSGAGSSSGRQLSVVNDTEGVYLTPAQRKAAEAKKEQADAEAVQYHADSGVRFDSEGRPVKASSSAPEVLPLADVPPEYTPS